MSTTEIFPISWGGLDKGGDWTKGFTVLDLKRFFRLNFIEIITYWVYRVYSKLYIILNMNWTSNGGTTSSKDACTKCGKQLLRCLVYLERMLIFGSSSWHDEKQNFWELCLNSSSSISLLACFKKQLLKGIGWFLFRSVAPLIPVHIG